MTSVLIPRVTPSGILPKGLSAVKEGVPRNAVAAAGIILIVLCLVIFLHPQVT